MKKEEKEALELNNELKRSLIRKRNSETNLLILKYRKEEKSLKESFQEPQGVLIEVQEPKENYLFFATLFTAISILEAFAIFLILK